MSKEKFREEIIEFLNEQIKGENDNRYKKEKMIRSIVLQGMDDDVDAIPEIITKSTEIYVSEEVERTYRYVRDFINHIR